MMNTEHEISIRRNKNRKVGQSELVEKEITKNMIWCKRKMYLFFFATCDPCDVALNHIIEALVLKTVQEDISKVITEALCCQGDAELHAILSHTLK